MSVELASGYHLENFLSLLRFVRGLYNDLLDTRERAYADQFELLSAPSQSLYVRLILRKGPLFRSDKLNYADIDDVDSAAQELIAAGLISTCASAGQLLTLLNKAELVALSPVAGAAKLRREALVAQVAATLEIHEQPLGFRYYRPLGTGRLRRFRLLYFGNLNQDFSDFVLADMGLLRFECYAIPASARLFNNRGNIDFLWLLYQLQDIADELIERQQTTTLIQFSAVLLATVPVVGPALIKRRWDRLLNRVARHLERCDQPHSALALYSVSQSPPARERSTRLLNSSGQTEAALALCRGIIEAPIDQQELAFAYRFGQRISKTLPAKQRIKAAVLDYTRRPLVLTRTQTSVEEAVRIFLEIDGGRCFYVENSLVPGFFGLAFWDIIFAPVSGAFVNPFQRGPLDLLGPGFSVARERAIADRLETLAQPGQLANRVQQTLLEKHGLANYFVHWQRLKPDLVALALARIPLRHWLVMFQRLLFDLKNNRSGFPDLIFFPAAGGYEMIEVKGPGDTLQESQKRWIRIFSEGDISFSVATVKWSQP
jgi:hypothetical protein